MLEGLSDFETRLIILGIGAVMDAVFLLITGLLTDFDLRYVVLHVRRSVSAWRRHEARVEAEDEAELDRLYDAYGEIDRLAAERDVRPPR